MTPDRIDDLLDRALATGAIPADATLEERTELERLLSGAGALQLNATRVQSEANAAIPTARARFQRHLASQQAPAPPPVTGAAPKQGWFGRFLGPRVLAFGGSVAALAVIAVLALVILQPFTSAQTASALTVDDYVQVSGVVSGNSDGTLTVQLPEVGDVQVAVNDTTSISDDAGARNATSLQPGDVVLVGGVVTEKRAIAASAVAVAKAEAGAPTPAAARKLAVLKKFKEGLEGTITMVSLAPNGKDARVLLVLPNDQILVGVERNSVDALLAEHASVVGLHVRVLAPANGSGTAFRLQFLERAAGPSPVPSTNPAPAFQNVRGTVIGRTANVLRVQTARGEVAVEVRRTTNVRLGDSGLTLQDILQGETVIGHAVVISGNPDPQNPRRVIAEIVVVQPKPATTAR